MVIGVLLIITTFTAYAKITTTCTSTVLKSKLRIAIILGTVFTTMSIGYFVCVMRKSCNCNFGLKATWQIYAFIATLLGMGIGMLILTNGIKNDMKQPGCDIDLGGTVDILMGLSITQIVISGLYIAYIAYSGAPQGSKKPVEEEDSDEVVSMRKLAAETVHNEDLKAGVTKKLTTLQSQLAKLNAKEATYTDRGKKAPIAIRTEIKTLQGQIKSADNEITSLEKEISSLNSQLGSSSKSNPSSNSNNQNINDYDMFG